MKHQDDRLGGRLDQFLAAIITCPCNLWLNPLLIPCALLQICSDRVVHTGYQLERRLINMENELGVTFALGAGLGGWRRDRPEWPMDVDVKRATRELHSLLPQVISLASVCAFFTRYAAWLTKLGDDLSKEEAFKNEAMSLYEIRSSTMLSENSIRSMTDFYEVMKGRSEAQINLLFTVVSQRDALESQRANSLNLEVARSTKEDSISIATFTFITAFFLPGSFIAALFSMSMFDWQDSSEETTMRILYRASSGSSGRSRYR